MRDAGAGTRGYMSASDRDKERRYNRMKTEENEKKHEKKRKRLKKMNKRMDKVEQKQSSQPSQPAKPATPENKSQKIEPVKESSVIQDAKSRVANYQKQDYSSIFKQNETDYTSKFQPSASGSSGAQKDPQNFADKYKFEVANSSKNQMDSTSDNPMSADDILKKDKEKYNY